MSRSTGDEARGFSLVELLIGLLLGSLAAAGALSAYAQGRASYETSQTLSRLNERAQYVLSALEADLQLAGYYGLHAASLLTIPMVPASADHCGAGHATRLATPVEASDRYTLACAPQTGGVVADTDLLTIRRASAQLATPDAGRLQLLTSLIEPASRSLLQDGQMPAATRLAAGQTELRDLVVRSYYVARRADGSANEPALRVKSLTRVAGVPRFVDTEVMPGVEDLQVELGYHDAVATSAELRWAGAGAAPPHAAVVAVRVSLRLRADSPDAHSHAFQRLQLTRSYALRNPVAS